MEFVIVSMDININFQIHSFLQVNMLSLTPRVLSTKFPKSAVPSAAVFVRSFASKIEEQGVAATGNLPPPKADPKEYGVNPDTIEHSWGFERKMIIARLMGDDRYEPKVFYRADKSTYDYPNLVPVHLDERLVMCECAPDNHYYVEFYIRKDGKPKRCKCGHWFKAIEADPESV